MSAVANDIVVRRLKVRVVRRGGWSWGPDTKALVESITRALPALLSRIVEQEGAGSEEDVEITSPLAIRVPLRLADLQRLGSISSADLDTEPAETATIKGLIGSALGASLADVRERGRATERSGPQSPQSAESQSTRSATDTAAPSSARALLELLRQWERDGELALRCSMLPPTLLREWLDHLRRDWPAPSIAQPVPDDALCARTRESATSEPLLLPAGPHASFVRLVIFATRLYLLGGVTPARACSLLVSAEDAAAEVATSNRSSGTETSPESIATRENMEPSPPIDHAVVTRSPAALESSREFELDVPSALPFLLLGPLAKTDYLQALRVACDVAGGTHLAAGFAAALAFKVLPAPQRGWYRDPALRRAASVFAGRRDDLDDPTIASSAYSLRTQTPFLDQTVTANLIKGHRADAAWLLCAGAGDELVLFDADGLFAVTTGTAAHIASTIAPSGSPLYVSRSTAASALFDTLDALQIPYVSGPRISTHGLHQGRMRGLAERGESLCERACSAWNALRHERPMLRERADASIETSLALAASLALGTIAWTLWRSREPTDALLTLERFSDLDARVHSSDKAIHVRLPLGRRFWDLRDRGLLTDVHDVPWLDGRSVTFGAG